MPDQIPLLDQILIEGDKDAIGFVSLLIAYTVWWIMEYVIRFLHHLKKKDEEEQHRRISIQDNDTFASLRLSLELDSLSDGTGSSTQTTPNSIERHYDVGDLERGDSISLVAEEKDGGMKVVRELAMLVSAFNNDDIMDDTQPNSVATTPSSSPPSSPPYASTTSTPPPTTTAIGQLLRKAPKLLMRASDMVRPLQPRRTGKRRSPFPPMIFMSGDESMMKDNMQQQIGSDNGEQHDLDAVSDDKEEQGGKSSSSSMKAVDVNGVQLIRDLDMLFGSFNDHIVPKQAKASTNVPITTASLDSSSLLSSPTTELKQATSSPPSLLIDTTDDKSPSIPPPPSPMICTINDDPVMKEKVPDSTAEERHRFLKVNRGNVNSASRALQQYLDWSNEHRVIREEVEKEIQSQKQECKEEDSVDGTVVQSEDEKLWELAAAMAMRSRNEKNQHIVKLPQVAAIYQLRGQDVRDYNGYRILKITPGRMDDRIADLKTYGLAVALFLDMKFSRNSLEVFTILMDARGGKGWRNNNGPQLLPFLRYVSGLLLSMFPERLARFVVYPVPESFLWIWKLVGTWFDTLTRERVELVPGESRIISPIPKEGLSKFVDPEIIDLIEEKRIADFIIDDEPDNKATTGEQQALWNARSENKGWHLNFLS